MKKVIINDVIVLDKNEKLFTPTVMKELKPLLGAAKNDALFNYSSWKKGSGYQGDVYLIPRTNIAVKLSHTKKRGSKPTALNSDIAGESKILQRVPTQGTHNQQLIARLKVDESLYALVTTRVEGQPLNESNMNEKVLKSLLDDMFILDKARILHCDLRPENILVDKYNKVGIIDYGASFEFDQFVPPYKIKESYDFYQHPVFWPQSNVRFFDFHTIFPHYDNLNSPHRNGGSPMNFITNYLKQRSHYHQKRADLFSEELQNAIKNKLFTEKQADQLKQSIRYEQLQTKIFENPQKRFIKLELKKIYIDSLAHDVLKRKFDGEPISLLITRKHELVAIDDYREAIQDIISIKSHELKDYEKEYLEFQKRFADFYELDVTKPALRKDLAEYLGKKSVDSKAVDLILNHLSKESRLLHNKPINSIVQKALSLIGSVDYELKQLLDV